MNKYQEQKDLADFFFLVTNKSELSQIQITDSTG